MSTRLPPSAAREVAIVRGSTLFDAAWYWARHADVRRLAMDPAEHYVLIGARLRRDPGPDFSTGYYLDAHQDVARAGINPLAHFEADGRAEGRAIRAADPADPDVARAQRPLAAAAPAPGLDGLDADARATIERAFDDAFYLRRYPHVAASGMVPLQHYLAIGSRLGWDPRPDFSTAFYLDASPDVRAAGIDPFIHYVLHGRDEGRPAQPFGNRFALRRQRPRVTAVVSVDGPQATLARRVDAILGQTWPELDIVLLHDADTEGTAAAEALRDSDPARIHLVATDGPVDRVDAWRAGLERGDSELVWFCDADDCCEPDFLARLVPWLQDPSVSVAVGSVRPLDGDGRCTGDHDAAGEEAGDGRQPLVRPAHAWFRHGPGIVTGVARSGGCVVRRQALPAAVWLEAHAYRALGDRFLACHLAGGGRIACEPRAIAYRRRPEAGGVGGQQARVEDEARLLAFLRGRWGMTGDAMRNASEALRRQHAATEGGPANDAGGIALDEDALLAMPREVPHVLIGVAALHDEEAAPVLALASELHGLGEVVSVLAIDAGPVDAPRPATLAAGVPVYFAGHAEDEGGMDGLLAATGASLVHSFSPVVDWALRSAFAVPYLVTLGAPYIRSGIGRAGLERIVERADRVSCAAGFDPGSFQEAGIDTSTFVSIADTAPLAVGDDGASAIATALRRLYRDMIG